MATIGGKGLRHDYLMFLFYSAKDKVAKIQEGTVQSNA